MRLTVLDLTRLLPGGYATHLLRNMGARVIKVEDPNRGDYLRSFPYPLEDGMSAYFHAINRGKESIVINLKKSPDLLLDLSKHADVLLEGFRPGVMERLGLGYDVISQRNQSLIYCSINGYGSDASQAQKPGHDINYLSATGLVDLQRGQDGEPAMPALQIADVAGGALFAVTQILKAVIERNESQSGCRLELSMLDGTASLMSFTAAASALTNHDVTWKDLMLNGQIPCYNIYPTSDNRWISVGNLEEKFWANFCLKLGRTTWLEKQFDRSSEFREEISSLFKTRNLDEWIRFFEGQETCVEPVRTISEAVSRGLFKYPDLPAPKHGQHTKTVLEEFLGENQPT